MAFYHHHGGVIKYLFAFVDFITYNAVFFLTEWFWGSDQYSAGEFRLSLLAFNLALVPSLIFSLSSNTQHAVMMDRVVLSTLKGLSIHALFFLAILNIIHCDYFSTELLCLLYTLTMFAVACVNIFCRIILKTYRLNGGNTMQAIIVGSGETARRLAQEMTNNEGFGYNIQGFFSSSPIEQSKFGDIRYLGKLQDIEKYLATHKIDEVYYSYPDDTPSNIALVTQISERYMARFYFVPPLGHWATRKFHLFTIGSGVPVLSVHRNPLDNPANRFIKRMFDIVFSAIVLVVFAIPVFLPVAIGVRLSSKGPILFRQKRTGYLGHEFYCLKFRSMYVNDDSDLICATRNDARVTRFGKFIRRFSIDELPQFWNTFVGDMSVVGPRPHMCSMNKRYASILSGYMVRHMIKPGITGWAQVNGLRGNAEDIPQIKRRVEHDVWYMDHWTFILDLKIIVRTIFNIIFGRDENAF